MLSATLLPTLRAFFRDSATALLFPACCRVCGAIIESLADGVACHRCWQATEDARLNFDYCEKCEVSLPRQMRQAQARRCGRCDEMAFAQARACGNYSGALRESVLWLKSYPMLPQRLQNLLSDAFWQLPEAQEIEAIIPVPLHLTREKERSFNQAEVISQVLARTQGLPVYATALQRTKATEKHRVGMDATARLKSIAGAFTVHAPRLIVTRRILLVDDVMTTGSTAHEIALELLESGARSVQVLTLARAVTSRLA